jgi:predicted dehydrogenase
MVAMAGKHLHMEKPGGTDLAEFRSLVRQLKEKELVFSVGYMYRFNPEIKRAIERIKAGKLGRIYSVDAEMSCKHPGEVREWLGAFPGGMMFFLGCHLIDIIYTIMGEPTQVIPLSCSTDPEGFGTEDFGMAVFKYPCGVSFAKTSASEYGGFLHRRLAISGECGSIEIRPLEAQDGEKLYSVTAEANSESWHEPWRTERSECFDRYDCMMRNFAELVRGKENPYSYDYELGLYELILKSSGK